MNLRQQISKFRSEILIGKYDSALSLGKSLIARLQLQSKLQQLGLISSENLKLVIQEEYEKCLTLNNHIHYRQVLKEEQNVKKWGSKNKSQDKSKWKKKEQSSKKQDESTPKQSKPSQKPLSSPIEQLDGEDILKFVDLLQTEIMMPIKMPSFYKEKSHFRVVTLRNEHRERIISYFLGNDFFKTDLSFVRNQLKYSGQKNFFEESSVQQILVECGQVSLESVMELKNHPKLKNCRLVFVISSEKNQLELL